MAKLFMPSCKVPHIYPEASRRLQAYLRAKGCIDRVVGCCLPSHSDHFETAADDTLVVVCLTCTAITREHEKAHLVTNVFDIILQDPAFPFPDLHGEEIAIQDCWRAKGNQALQDTVRALAHRMNITPVDLPQSRDASRFCGLSLYADINPEFSEIAPAFAARAMEDGVFTKASNMEKQRLMREYAAALPTERVLCYCSSCDTGLRTGGANSIALLNLLFGVESTPQGR